MTTQHSAGVAGDSGASWGAGPLCLPSFFCPPVGNSGQAGALAGGCQARSLLSSPQLAPSPDSKGSGKLAKEKSEQARPRLVCMARTPLPEWHWLLIDRNPHESHKSVVWEHRTQERKADRQTASKVQTETRRTRAGGWGLHRLRAPWAAVRTGLQAEALSGCEERTLAWLYCSPVILGR